MAVLFKAEEIKTELDNMSEEEIVEILHSIGFTYSIDRVVKLKSQLDKDKCLKYVEENGIQLINKWVDTYGPIMDKTDLARLGGYLLIQSVHGAIRKQ